MATKVDSRVEVDRRGNVIVRSKPRRTLTATVIVALARLLHWLVWTLPFRLTRAVARSGWRNRWHVSPVVGAVWVLTYGPIAPAVALLVLAVTAVLAVFGGATKVRIGERMHLGRTERYALAEGAIGAALWVAGEWGAEAAGAHLPAWLSAGAYVVLTGHAAGVWWWSRRPAWWPRRLTGEAKHYTGQWDAVAVVTGGLEWSHIIRPTITSTDDGDVTFTVQLTGHHIEDVDDASRKVVERTIKVKGGASLPHRSVQLAPVDHDVTQVRVSISPARAMEAEPVLSGGIHPLRRDGSLDLAADSARRPVRVHAFSKTGTRFAMISGGSDSGKSNTLARLILPGLITLNDGELPIETCWSLDGGLGTSTPYLAPAFDANVVRPELFGLVIEVVFAVHRAREERRGRAGRHDWRTWQEEDPILTLLVQEARGVAARLEPRHHAMYAEMAMRVRKTGLRLIQESQDLSRGNIIGGQDAPEVRKQLANNGVVLAHRDGEDDKRPLQGSHDATQLVRGVNALPPGGGWLIPMEQGKVLAARARTLWDEIEHRAEVARSVAPRPLTGADLEAALSVKGAQEWLEHRRDPDWTPPKPETAEAPDEALTSGPRPFVPVQAVPARDRVLQAIKEHMAKTGEPLGKTLAGKAPGDGGYGIPGATWELVRPKLQAEGKIHQPVPGKWAPVFPGGKP